MDFNFGSPRTFVNDRLLAVPAFAGGRGRVKLSREEEEALKEQNHRRALAFLEAARRQQNGPLSAGGPASALGRSIGAGQIEDPGAAAVNALGLDPGKISNAGFAGLQRKAPFATEVNNSRASDVPFVGGTVAAPAAPPAQRGSGGNEKPPGSPQAIEKARAVAIRRLASYISGAKVTLQAKEDGAVALYDPENGKTRYLFGGEAGRGRNGRFDYRFNKKTREIILAWAHSHPKQGKRGGRGVAGRKGTDRDNESIRDNPDDQARSETAPLVLKTPSGNVIVCIDGVCRDY